MTTSKAGMIICLSLLPLAHVAGAQEKRFDAYPGHVVEYLQRIYDPGRQPFAFRPGYPGGFRQWQRDARAEFLRKLALGKIAEGARGHVPRVTLEAPEDLGGYTRQRGVIETEPGVRLPFWLLKPKGAGPWPLAVLPHGHSSTGHDTTAGVFANEAARKRALAEDRDTGVQAVQAGFLAIAPAVRGLSADGVPDLNGRHGKQDCRSHLMHCLAAGRTAMGERVWDLQRILDWASKLPEADSRHILMMGNSGGGVATIFAAAADERITIAVPSCSFAPTVGRSGYIFHCDCNMVPGLVELGGMPALAGLIAPRHLLAVNGRADKLFPVEEVESAAARARELYRAAGAAERFEHRWGDAGHRFYKDLMWPFIERARRAE